MAKNPDTEATKSRLRAKKKPESGVDYAAGLSTGSTLLNLALTGRPSVGWLPGTFNLFVGDSGSGKTFLVLTALAEACVNAKYKGYRLIFDKPEEGALMDFNKFFPPLAERWQHPSVHGSSEHLESFYHNADRAFDAGKPFVYALDSFDALPPKAQLEQFADARRAADAGKADKAKGSYGTEKARVNSSHMRVLFNRLTREKRSILVAISQSRENIGFDATFNPKTRGGGKALTFYATSEIWTSVRKHLKRKYRDKDVEVGVVCRLTVKKNRASGRVRSVDVPILHEHGIDDLGSMVAWMVEWSFWREDKGKLTAPEFGFSGPPEKLVAEIEAAGAERQLRLLVADCWEQVEEAVAVQRKPRYGDGAAR